MWLRFFPQHELFDSSAKHGILLMAHQPLGGRPVGVVRAHPDEPFPTDDPTASWRQKFDYFMAEPDILTVINRLSRLQTSAAYLPPR
jgi:diketogulonate reductase-like aldo/keto reductase